ncbi:ubiquitin-related modifier 1 isoform X1 [Heterocephalus glaber]|uniref:Ubiquitin-related modifier 1 n=1 Tax=Heterocephalus glaber TaxID=10181 RepID=A0AAX6TA23_HETGA|nr:ubiquitin-related modifier 1 isoform X1 [Heterocephalus glaber]
MAAPLSVEVEFGGGAELLFDGIKKHQVTLPGQEEPWDIRNLLVWIKKNLLKERPELFIQGDSVATSAQKILCRTAQGWDFRASLGAHSYVLRHTLMWSPRPVPSPAPSKEQGSV